MGHVWDFGPVIENWDVLVDGLRGTLLLFAVCSVLGLGGGLLVGMARYARRRLLSLPAAVFVEIFRNTPVLIQIVWFYFAFPIVSPIEIGAFTAAVMGISLNTAAFSADIYRAGIQSIERGQWDGARAIGMSAGQAMRRVILPQAIKRILPALTNRGIEVLKMSTLASVIAYAETMHQAKALAAVNFNPIETYTAVALLFFVVLFPLVQLTYALERRFGRSD
ncbi:MAG: amino acid ABC transporter permease [Alphaproteobacteria bacterium]|nr:amino acid ABC transporter permease [Alphaproteobacteria bacterium]